MQTLCEGYRVQLLGGTLLGKWRSQKREWLLNVYILKACHRRKFMKIGKTHLVVTVLYIQMLKIGLPSANEREPSLKISRGQVAPKDATTVNAVHCMVTSDRIVTIQHIAIAVGVSFGSVQIILSDVTKSLEGANFLQDGFQEC